MSRSIDLNSDIGEMVTGNFDELVAGLVSSVNISCGVHAGSPQLTLDTMKMALRLGKAIGAHPGMPGGGGREQTAIDPQLAFTEVKEQLASFRVMAAHVGAVVDHVKPHGALYNQAETNPAISSAIVAAILEELGACTVYGLAEGRLIAAAQAAGLRSVGEFFADRAYAAGGTLEPRTVAGSVIDDSLLVRERTMKAVEEGTVTTSSGALLRINFASVCVHADTPDAFSIVQVLSSALAERGILIRSPS